MQAIKLGSDPEVFVSRDKKIISGIGLIGGTKDKPRKLVKNQTQRQLGLAVQEDGVTLEFNLTPVTGSRHFMNFHRAAIGELRSWLAPKNLELNILSEFDFPDNELMNVNARTFGCDPDFQAHEQGLMRRPPKAEDVGNQRFAGGHIHFGFEDTERVFNDIPPWAIVQFIDAYATLHWNKHFVSVGRRKYYGLPGLYRVKPYGIEYRTPSNLWLQDEQQDYAFLTRAESIVALVTEYPTVARMVYDRINFDEVRQVLTEEKNVDSPILKDIRQKIINIIDFETVWQ